MEYYKLFTSESVSEGHPDKLCDQISDGILTEILKQDKLARVACEVAAFDNTVIIGGEITTSAKVDYEKIARSIIKDIGYTDPKFGIDFKTCEVLIKVNTQSPEIAQSVSTNDDLGAGDQGIMFGYATNETKTFMPLPISMAHEIVKLASKLRKDGKFKWSRPDMKSQVTYDYTKNRIDTILVSFQHDEDYDKELFADYIKKNILDVVAKNHNLNTDYKAHINPSGRFTIGGPKGDSGLTGRKIIIDTYGGMAKHGGGAFSGKDPSKVDRSAAYMARYIAKNIVAAELADQCEVQLSYGIGIKEPISIFIDTFGTGKISDEEIVIKIWNTFNLTPSGIVKQLDLLNVDYYQLASYGHIGREDLKVAWEKVDQVKNLK